MPREREVGSPSSVPSTSGRPSASVDAGVDVERADPVGADGEVAARRRSA